MNVAAFIKRDDVHKHRRHFGFGYVPETPGLTHVRVSGVGKLGKCRIEADFGYGESQRKGIRAWYGNWLMRCIASDHNEWS